MAHFYADVQGNRGQATRCGSKESGIRGHIRGWNVGCRVVCYATDTEDVVEVYRTEGSNGGGREQLIAKWSEKAQ